MKKAPMVFISFAFLALTACDKGGDHNENESFEGKWLFAGTVKHGKRTEATEKEKGKGIVFSGEKFLDDSGALTTEGTFKVDAAKKPKAIQLTFTGGLAKGQIVTFAYELKGDSLRLTQTLDGEYVTEFDSAKWLIQEFVREKK